MSHTRSSLRWFSKSKATSSVVPFSHFVNDHIFALKTGGYGILFQIDPIDDEGMSDSERLHVVQQFAAMLKQLPLNARLYQYLVKRKGYRLPGERDHENRVVREMVSTRIAQLESGDLRRTDAYWCFTIGEKRQVWQSPTGHAKQSSELLARLQRIAGASRHQFSDLLSTRMLDQQAVIGFFSYVFLLRDYAFQARLKSSKRLGRQIGRRQIHWREDHLQIGQRYVRPFTFTGQPPQTTTNLLRSLTAINADMVLCSQWAQRSQKEVREEVSNQEFFQALFRNKLQVTVMNARQPSSLDSTAASKAASKKVDALADVLSSLDSGEQLAYGSFSMHGFVHADSLDECGSAMQLVDRALVDAQIDYVQETEGCLAALYSILPGNTFYNVSQMWMRNDDYADLSFLYGPDEGSKWSDDLEREYLAVFETRDGTPFFYDPYVNGLRGTLIVGAPRRGKSVTGNFIVANEQKFGGYTYIFDIGGSYESTVLVNGGVSVHLGVNGPRMSLFRLKQTKGNLDFLFGFIRMLLRSGGATLTADDETTISRKVEQMYMLDPDMRRLSTLQKVLPNHLRRYLDKWVEGGIYGNVFDNAEDDLHLARLQCFDFQGITKEQQDLLKPLLFWIIRRVMDQVRDPALLHLPKHMLLDEVWRHISEGDSGDDQMLQLIIESLKTGGKHLLGVSLLTHTTSDLGAHLPLIKNACPSTLFLGDPTFDRDQYKKIFNLNDREILNLASLGPREMMLKTPEFSKILRLNLDSESLWMFTTKPKDRRKRIEAISRYGIHDAFKMLAAEAS